MPTIVVLNANNLGDWYTVGETPMVFGRDQDLLAEILDPCVSHRHMQIVLDKAEGFYARDLGSRNGVIVNGQRIKKLKLLRDGDLLQIGFTLLIFTATDFASDRAARGFTKKNAKRFKSLIKELENEEAQRLEKSLDQTQGFHPIT